jgi:hypothetical protein
MTESHWRTDVELASNVAGVEGVPICIDGIDARLKSYTLGRVQPGKKHRALNRVAGVVEQCPCRYIPGL